jgi:glycosyltransferase involved in cell wall biosynthesis
MRIGFDAKRVFYNTSGLGNYSRDTIELLAEFFPGNDYFLYTPKVKNSLDFSLPRNAHLSLPSGMYKTFKNYWRVRPLASRLEKDNIDVYHGLSNELPFGIHSPKVATVVSIHDLIFLRYPRFYKLLDRLIYNTKFSNACKQADRIIAISNQTKEDVIRFYKIPEPKIQVVYQGCSNIFYRHVPVEEKKEISRVYQLPVKFLLSVGTIEKRKNFLSVIHALKEGNIDMPYVIIGRKTNYLQELKNHVEKYNLKNVFFIHNVKFQHLPAIYQMAEIFLYPSLFEGFGIPILEALNSRVPVITSKDGCFAETGGDGALYVDPGNPAEIAHVIQQILRDNNLKSKLIKAGEKHAMNFHQEKIANQLMNLYKSL